MMAEKKEYVHKAGGGRMTRFCPSVFLCPSVDARVCCADLRAFRARKRKLYSTCASPVVPHPSTGHAHGCLASEIGRDPAFPTRYDRTVASLEVSLLAPSQTGKGLWIIIEGVEIIKKNQFKDRDR